MIFKILHLTYDIFTYDISNSNQYYIDDLYNSFRKCYKILFSNKFIKFVKFYILTKIRYNIL